MVEPANVLAENAVVQVFPDLERHILTERSKEVLADESKQELGGGTADQAVDPLVHFSSYVVMVVLVQHFNYILFSDAKDSQDLREEDTKNRLNESYAQ